MSIDDLLSQPLPAVPDNGFSARVMERVKRENRRHIALIAGVSAAGVAVVAAFVPLPALTAQLNNVLIDLATSPAVGAAAAALLLTILADRKFFSL